MEKFLHIITSKNRGPQLELQLRSVHKYLPVGIRTIVLYTTTSKEHEEVYSALKNEYSTIEFVKENNYKEDVEKIIETSSCKYFFFTPDDGAFIRPVSLSILNYFCRPGVIFSLRLGRHLTKCHPVGNKDQPLPSFTKEGEGFTWFWNEGILDWAYPLALDGSIFDKALFFDSFRSIQYNKPTSLEIGLQKFVPYINHLKGACLEKAQFVSIPWNAVTDGVSNPNSNISEEEFLTMWNDRYRISYIDIDGSLPRSCHYEYELVWEKF